MTDQDTIKEQVLSYLQDQFNNITITEVARLFSDDGLAFRIQADEEEYQLRILDEVIAQEGVEHIAEFLASNNAVSVMRDLIGFPVTMTKNGCVFYDV